ncbi:MAG: hypothetical protein D6714_12350 [Bacteroidetes bacterium]|nr:MAG: hypothetical protein D6714_12350 [Bacteroidota bacterium]
MKSGGIPFSGANIGLIIQFCQIEGFFFPKKPPLCPKCARHTHPCPLANDLYHFYVIFLWEKMSPSSPPGGGFECGRFSVFRAVVSTENGRCRS